MNEWKFFFNYFLFINVGKDFCEKMFCKKFEGWEGNAEIHDGKTESDEKYSCKDKLD